MQASIGVRDSALKLGCVNCKLVASLENSVLSPIYRPASYRKVGVQGIISAMPLPITQYTTRLVP